MQEINKYIEENMGYVRCVSGCIYILHFKKDVIDIILNNFNKENNLKTPYKDINKLLYSVGEDRFLTSIILRYFGKYTTGYCNNSIVYTVCPSTFKQFYKQRIRWSNSIMANTYYYENFIFKEKDYSISLPIIFELCKEYINLSFMNNILKVLYILIIFVIIIILSIKNIYLLLFIFIFEIIFITIKYKLPLKYIIFLILECFFGFIINLYTSLSNIFNDIFIWGTREGFHDIMPCRDRYKYS
jgi:chitin synthase